MNHRAFTVGLACAALLGAACLVVLSVQSRALRARSLVVQQQLAAHHRSVCDRLVRPASTPGDGRASAATAAAAGSAAAGASPGSSSLGRGFAVADRLAAMPEFGPVLRRELRRQTIRQYGALFPLLHLTPERLEAFKALLDETNATMRDLYSRALAYGPSFQSPELQKLVQQYSAEADEQARALLGADGYAQYAAYRQTAVWRDIYLPELEPYFALHGTMPLTDGQRQALADAFQQVQDWTPAGGSLAAGPLFRQRNERLAQIAGSSFAPAQKAVLDEYIRFTNAREQVLARHVRPDDPDGIVAAVSSSRSGP